jgi:predicted nucleotidyltransferase
MYLEALKSLGSGIRPFKVARHGADYHDKMIKGDISSATAIRRSMGKNSMYLDSVPANCAKLIKSALAETGGPVTTERFYKTFLYAASKDENALSELADISGGLDMRMKKMMEETVNLDDYIKSVKTKSYTYVRVARAVFNLILGINSDATGLIRKSMPMYARVLGFKKEASKLIDLMHERSSIPVFTQTSQFFPLTQAQKRLFEIDLFASDAYYIHAEKKFIKDTDYKNQVVII